MSTRPTLSRRIAAAALTAIALGVPAGRALAEQRPGEFLRALVAGLVGLLVLRLVATRPGGRVRSVLGAALVVMAVWLLPQGPPGIIVLVIAAIGGAGAGFGIGRDRAGLSWRAFIRPDDAAALGAAVVVAWVANTRSIIHVWELAAVAAGAVLVLTTGRVESPQSVAPAGRVVTAVVTVFAVLVACWIGANSMTATWFSPMVANGPTSRDEVAITFDDGPNDSTTLPLAQILEDHGVRGTFFLVGKAVVQRPAVVRELVARGHLIANHSYLHDSVSWLHPSYPELDRAQRAIEDASGTCPAFFRPPHGQKTPFMGRVVTDRGMSMIIGGPTAGDWATNDADLVARRILGKVHKGSIIVLHDGLDGDPTVDRTVLLRAVPKILDGLQAKGLKVVGLDELIGRSGWLGDCAAVVRTGA
jgi:peptidoglycan/xylan/chitin deacetylase (PgdA/CDA1 family)